MLHRVAQRISLVRNHKPKEITWNPKESSRGPPSVLMKTPSSALRQPHRPRWRLLCPVARKLPRPCRVRKWETAKLVREVVRDADGQIARFKGKGHRRKCRHVSTAQAPAMQWHFGKNFGCYFNFIITF